MECHAHCNPPPLPQCNPSKEVQQNIHYAVSQCMACCCPDASMLSKVWCLILIYHLPPWVGGLIRPGLDLATIVCWTPEIKSHLTLDGQWAKAVLMPCHKYLSLNIGKGWWGGWGLEEGSLCIEFILKLYLALGWQMTSWILMMGQLKVGNGYQGLGMVIRWVSSL